jgi:transcription factor SFP1
MKPRFDWLFSHPPSTSRAAIGESVRPDFIDSNADEGAGLPALTNDVDSPTSFDSQPTTPPDFTTHLDQSTMPSTSPIDIATPTRNASSSPSSQGKKTVQYLDTADTDSRTSAMMSANYDSSMGRGRQDSFGGAKPISMNNPNKNTEGRPRRESMAGSLVGGMSWGGVSVGSWIRDE